MRDYDTYVETRDRPVPFVILIVSITTAKEKDGVRILRNFWKCSIHACTRV